MKSNSLVNSNYYLPNLDEIFSQMFRGVSLSNNYQVNEDGSYSLVLDVPGIKESDLNLEINKGYLVVTGESKVGSSVRRVNHKISLPEHLDTENVNAVLENGVLALTFQVLSDSKNIKKIEIKSK